MIPPVLADEHGCGAYDALNDLYVDDRGALARRIDWSGANVDDAAVADLVSRRWVLAAEEEVLCLPG